MELQKKALPRRCSGLFRYFVGTYCFSLESASSAERPLPKFVCNSSATLLTESSCQEV